MATCPEIQGLLSAYLDGELAEVDRERVQRHLAACQACAAELRDLDEMASLLRCLLEADPTEAIRLGLRRRLRRRSAAIVAAAFLVLIAIVPVVAMAVSLLRPELPLLARVGFGVSTFCFAAGLAILVFHLLRDVRHLVIYGYLVGSRQ